jgi:diguanylate cyclase (GGDEF)-like protein
MSATARIRMRGGRRATHVTDDDRVLLRFVGAAQYVAGAVFVFVLTLLPDPDPTDHSAAYILAAVGLANGAARWFARDSGAPLSRLTNLGCIVFVGAIVATARPLGAAALLMLWPVMNTAYFLGRRDLTLAAMIATATLAISLSLNPTVRDDLTLVLAPTAGILLTTSLLMVLLRERLDQLIGDLERTASTDGLTGLANRRTWHQAFDREVERARRTGMPLAVAMFDIDRFKAINDCFGHAEGDKALIRFANLLATECRSFDIPGRLGGEEFGLLLVGSPAEGGAAFAERLRERLELVTQHDLTPFTVSCGIAQLDVHGSDPEHVMLAADRALYRSKHEGRDRFTVADAPQGLPDEPLERVDECALSALADDVGQSAEQLSLSVTLKLEPQPQAATTLGFSTLNPAPVSASTKSITEPST